MNIRKTVTTKELLDKIGHPIGEDGFICCPAHEDNRPSLKVYDNYDGFYCFQCGEGGGPVEFLQLYTGWDEKECVKKIIQSFKLDDQDGGLLRRLTESKETYARNGTTRLTSMVFEEWEKEFCKWGISFIHTQDEEVKEPLWKLWDHFLERVDYISQSNYITKSLRGLPELFADMKTMFIDYVAFIKICNEEREWNAESNGNEGVLQSESEQISVGVGSPKSEDSGKGVGGQDTTCC